MTIQWLAIQLILYAEIIVSFVFLQPWIRPKTWRKFFNSNFVLLLRRKFYPMVHVTLAGLVLLVADSIRENYKYSYDNVDVSLTHATEAESVVHMRLFRAQRNFYIAGFALLLFFLNKRIIGLLYQSAHLEMAADEAIGAKPGTAWDLSAKKEEVDQLQKDLANEREEKEKVAEEKEHLRHEADQAKDLLLEKQ
ncbi:B-cell receptor-associated protein 31-like containing protein, partial [Aphelenchoides avenae]